MASAMIKSREVAKSNDCKNSKENSSKLSKYTFEGHVLIMFYMMIFWNKNKMIK